MIKEIEYSFFPGSIIEYIFVYKLYFSITSSNDPFTNLYNFYQTIYIIDGNRYISA